MGAIVVRLNAGALANPDLDLRYVLPDLLAERSGGAIRYNGYDYANEGADLVLFLKADRPGEVVGLVIEVIENVAVLDNDLRPAATVTVEEDGRSEVVYPRAG